MEKLNKNCNFFGLLPCFLKKSFNLTDVFLFFSDDNDDDDSMLVLSELEKIDDDCDKQGIQFVKIDDPVAAKDFGIDSIPALVYFEKEIPNVYDGDLENEDEILEWLVAQLESDEIEDVTDEMLDKMIKEGKTIAVLFCKFVFTVGGKYSEIVCNGKIAWARVSWDLKKKTENNWSNVDLEKKCFPKKAINLVLTEISQ